MYSFIELYFMVKIKSYLKSEIVMRDRYNLSRALRDGFFLIRIFNPCVITQIKPIINTNHGNWHNDNIHCYHNEDLAYPKWDLLF